MINVSNNYGHSYTAATKVNDKTKDYADANEYFKKLVAEHPNVKLVMSDVFKNVKGQVNLCISPAYIQKAMKNPEVAKKLERDINQIPDAEAYIRSLPPIPGGKKIKSVSYSINQFGEGDINVQWEEPKSEKTDDDDDEKKKREKKIKSKLRTNKLNNAYTNLSNPYIKNYYANTSNIYNLNFVNKNL